MQFFDIDRLCKEVRKSLFCEIGFRIGEEIGCQGNDRKIFSDAVHFSQLLYRLDSVHSGHHMVQENQIIVFCGSHCECIKTVGRHINIHFIRFHQSFCNGRIDIIVIYDQYVGRRKRCILVNVCLFGRGLDRMAV